MYRSHRDPVKPGTGPMTGIRYQDTVSGTWCSVSPITPGKPGSSVTPGESVRPVHTGLKAQLEKADQCLARSELLVLNSPDRSVQLEHNVHEPLGNMPSLQIEHLSEHSHVFQDFTNSDSPNVRADKSPERIHLRHSGHRSSGIGHTGNPLGIGHTGNRSDHEHSVPRSRSVRSDAIEHGSTEPDIALMSFVLFGMIVTHIVKLFPSDTLTQENTSASMIRHRRSRSRSRSYNSVSPRRHSRFPSRSRGKKKKSHEKRKHSSTSSSYAALSLIFLEKEIESGTSLKRRRRNTLNHVRQM